MIPDGSLELLHFLFCFLNQSAFLTNRVSYIWEESHPDEKHTRLEEIIIYNKIKLIGHLYCLNGERRIAS